MNTVIAHTINNIFAGVLRPALVVRQGFVATHVMNLGWFGFAQEQNIEPDTNAVLSGGSTR